MKAGSLPTPLKSTTVQYPDLADCSVFFSERTTIFQTRIFIKDLNLLFSN